MTDKNDTKYTAFVFHVLKMILQGGKDTEICITPFFDFINQRFPTQKILFQQRLTGRAVTSSIWRLIA